MAIIQSYPTVVPSTTDLLIIADSSDNENPTKTVTIGSILNLPSGSSGLSGAGTAGQVTYWNGTESITGSSDFTFDASLTRLLIGLPLVKTDTAILDLTSTKAGFLPPRMSTSQRIAISNPAEALIVYDTDERSAYIYSGLWVKIGGNSYSWTIGGDSGGATVASGTNVKFEGDGIITTGYDATSNILTITGNALTSVSPGPGITVSTLNNVATVSALYSGATNIIKSANVGSGVTSNDNFLYEDSNGDVNYVEISEIIDLIPAGSNTTYTFQTAPTGTALRLNGNDSSVNDVTISGTSNETNITRITSTELRVGLTDDVSIANDLTVGGELTVAGTGNSIFNGQVTIPQSPSVGTDAASKAYVDSVVGGVNGFQGGYNANTNTPALTGASNVGLSKGNFYVVTVGGSFFTETLEVGDFIFANDTIVASSTPALSDYTVVIADENIAAAGATDAGTQKGVAGFDEDFFTVTANGWVQSKTYTGGANQGVVPTGGIATTFLAGDGSWQTPAGTSYSAATASALGLIKLGSDVELQGSIVTGNAGVGVSQRVYPVQFNASDNAAVYVPWVNNNNTYLAGIGLDLVGSTFNCKVDATKQAELPETVVNVQDRCFAIQEQETSGNLVVNVPYKDYSAGHGLIIPIPNPSAVTIDVDYVGVGSTGLGNIIQAATFFNTTGNSVNGSDTFLLKNIQASAGVYQTTVDELNTYLSANGTLMTSTAQGEAKLFSDTEQTVPATTVSAATARTYGLQLNSSDQLVVNVPWEETRGRNGLSQTTVSGLFEGYYVQVDYIGNNNIILTAPTQDAQTTPDKLDEIIINSTKSSNDVKKLTIERLAEANVFTSRYNPATWFGVDSAADAKGAKFVNDGNIDDNTQGLGTIADGFDIQGDSSSSTYTVTFGTSQSTQENYMVFFTIEEPMLASAQPYAAEGYIQNKTANGFELKMVPKGLVSNQLVKVNFQIYKGYTQP